MKAPLYHAIQKYVEDDIYPFHMPGHKQGQGGIISNLYQIDVTEVEGMDNLHHAEGVIQEAQNLMAKTFGAEDSFFLVNGSTGGITAAILTVCNPGDVFLTARNCHRSVYSGMILVGCLPSYIQPTSIEPYQIIGGIAPGKVKEALEKNPNAKAVCITSPTYEGFTSDIEEIAKIVHGYDGVLIVDEAHGAHFRFHQGFPKTALECGADMVVQSIHKTLPAFTQSAVLHIQGKRVDRERLRQMLALTQTSSPSYILMAGLDVCRSDLDQYGRDQFERHWKEIQSFRTKASELRNLYLLGEELQNQYHIAGVDLSKLVFYIRGNIGGKKIEEILRNQYQIQMEMYGPHHIVGITSIADREEGLEKLLKALLEIDNQLDDNILFQKKRKIVYPSTHVRMNPREAAFASKKAMDINTCAGEIAGEFVIPYPPGIPILCPGELITKEHQEQILLWKQSGVTVTGMRDHATGTIQVIDKKYLQDRFVDDDIDSR